MKIHILSLDPPTRFLIPGHGEFSVVRYPAFQPGKGLWENAIRSPDGRLVGLGEAVALNGASCFVEVVGEAVARESGAEDAT